MPLIALAAVWYAVLIGLVAVSIRLGRRRLKAAEALTLDETYEDRRRQDRARHLARVREDELAQMRRAASRRRPLIGIRV